MSREALVLLVCCCDFRDGAERLIPSKSLRNAVIRAFPGLLCILRMCAPRRAAAVVRPRGREKSADRRRRILISRLLIIRASVPRRKSPFPAYFKGFPAVSPLIPPYPAFLKYPVSPQQLKAGPVNILAVICAVCAFAAIIWIQIADRRQRIGYGFAAEPIAFTIIKNVLIFIVAGFIFYKMATYRGIPLILLILLAFVLIYNFIATKTIIGRQVYALGGNRAAAALSGINTKRLMLIVYANSSFMAAVSSIIVTARLNAASTSAGTNFELDAIAACYIGGCAAGGGEGTIMGVLIGALVMGILNNGMSIMGIGADFQKVVKGAILLLAVTYDVYSKQSKSNG